ncbi:MAG: HAD family hydrolase [Alphaproteobacteria bacterium]|nr:HAD family hydrolase [Alphaproteobacteria bacterium SS10]
MARNSDHSPGGESRNPNLGNPGDFKDVDTIILDLDDTIVAGTPALLAYVDTIYRGLARMSRLPLSDVAEGFKDIRAEEIYAFASAFNDHGPLKEKFPHRDLNAEFGVIREQAEQAMIAVLEPDPDFVQAIKQWREQGYRLIMMTEGPGSATAVKLNAIGLADDMDELAVVSETTPTGIDDLEAEYPSTIWPRVKNLPAGFKAKPEVIAETLKDWGVDPNRSVMIGNRVDRDLAPMQSLGARTILVTQFDRPNEDALKQRFMDLIFAGGERPPGSGGAVSEDKGGITPDAELPHAGRLTELLPGPPGYQPGKEPGQAPDGPDVQSRRRP